MKFLKDIIFFYLITIPLSGLSTDLGTIGLIDIPSARMMDDGLLKGSFSSQKIANITNLTYQASPWLETTFRYTIFNPDNEDRYNPNIDGLNDRSYGIKVRLREEGELFPQIAFGMQDILGTGAWSAEYFVASKKIKSFDFSIGLGWGRLSGDSRSLILLAYLARIIKKGVLEEVRKEGSSEVQVSLQAKR